MVEPTACAVHGALAAGVRRRRRSSWSSAPARSACSPSPPSAATPRRATCWPWPSTRCSASSPGRSAPTASSPRRSWPAPCAGPAARSPSATATSSASPGAPTWWSTASAARPAWPRPSPWCGPAGRVAMVGMPGHVHVDLTGLWQREITLAGAYAYGTETLPDGTRRRTFDLAFELVAEADLGRLVSRHLPAVRATPTPSPTPPQPAAGARCASPSTSETRRNGTVPRPGFVLDVDRSTPPILFHHGEGFRLEKLPAGRSAGSIYPAEPLEALEHPDAAIRDALAQPRRRLRAAAGAAEAGDEAHHRLRRHLAPAAADEAARHPPAGHRGRARPGRGGGRRRRRCSSPPSPSTGA